MKKKFKDTKIGMLLKDKLPGILDTVDDFFPPAKILTALISGKADIPPMEKAALYKEIALYEQAEYKLHLEEIKLHNENTKDARDMQRTAIGSSDWLTRNYLYLLATVIILGAVGFGIALFFVAIPEGNRRMIEMFADLFLFAGAMMVLNFFFGSSAGSKKKTDAMAKMMDK